MVIEVGATFYFKKRETMDDLNDAKCDCYSKSKKEVLENFIIELKDDEYLLKAFIKHVRDNKGVFFPDNMTAAEYFSSRI